MKVQQIILPTLIIMAYPLIFTTTAWGQDPSFSFTCPDPWMPTASFENTITYPNATALGSTLTENLYNFSISNSFSFYTFLTGHATPYQGLYAAVSVNTEFPISPFSGQLANTGKVWMLLFHYGNDVANITVYDKNNVSIPFTVNKAYSSPPPPPATPINSFNIYIEADSPISMIEYHFPYNEVLLVKLCAY